MTESKKQKEKKDTTIQKQKKYVSSSCSENVEKQELRAHGR
jgi:hypothetical protein